MVERVLENKTIPLARPYVGNEELEKIQEVFKSGILTRGEVVKEFERKFKEHVKVRYAISTSSCTTAMHLALASLGIGNGDEVIVPDFTFPATANAVIYQRARPVLCDIDKKTFNLLPEKIPELITRKTKAIMPVHLFGHSVDMDPIIEIAEKNDLHTVWNAACALGTLYKGRDVGTIGEISCYSFHPRKILTTGEGGMLVTNHEELAEKALSLRNHGQMTHQGKTVFKYVGYNYRLTEMCAAIGIVQLERLPAFIADRQRVARIYDEMLSKLDAISKPFVADYSNHTYQSYVTTVNETRLNRDEVLSKLRKEGIEAQIGTHCLHVQPCYERIVDFSRNNLLNAERAYRTSLTLPMYYGMTDEDARQVMHSLRKVTEQH